MQGGSGNRGMLATLLSPAVFWLLAFFVAPLLIVFVVSFGRRSLLGMVEYTFTLDNYLRVFTDTIYLRILWQSLLLAIGNTILCLIIAYPFAFFIARRSPRWQNILIFLVMVPFWTNFLIRTYALIFILRDTGLINSTLIGLGVIEQPIIIMFTQTAVMIGMVYGYLPFAVLPLYASIEQLDFNYV
ncbi:MAG TPA: ABC transporter permease, partial [Anaerolineae bacterium]|nr:ABC transporter permease [Anaerolineae bacterium]